MKRFRSAYLLLILLGAGCGQSPEPVAEAEPPAETAKAVEDDRQVLWSLIEQRCGACMKYTIREEAIKAGIEKYGKERSALISKNVTTLAEIPHETARAKAAVNKFCDEMEAKLAGFEKELDDDLESIDRQIRAEVERLSR